MTETRSFRSSAFGGEPGASESERPDSRAAVDRKFHEFDADWFARGQNGSSSVADFKLWILKLVCGQASRITFGVLVFLYLWLTFVAISLDLGVYCISPKHGQMDMKHLEPMNNPTHVTHYIDKHTSRLRRHGRTITGTLSPEEEDEQQVDDLLQVPRAMLRGAKAVDQVMVCEEPMVGYGAIFSETLGLSCLIISAAQMMENLLRMYAMGSTFFFSFFSLDLDFFFTFTGFCGDLAINLFLRPWASQSVELQRPDPWVIYALFALRLWRCTMLWRLVRSIRGDFSAGSELLWVFQGMEVISSEAGGMAKASVTKVCVVKCTHHELDDYRSRRSICVRSMVSIVHKSCSSMALSMAVLASRLRRRLFKNHWYAQWYQQSTSCHLSMVPSALSTRTVVMPTLQLEKDWSAR